MTSPHDPHEIGADCDGPCLFLGCGILALSAALVLWLVWLWVTT